MSVPYANRGATTLLPPSLAEGINASESGKVGITARKKLFSKSNPNWSRSPRTPCVETSAFALIFRSITMSVSSGLSSKFPRTECTDYVKTLYDFPLTACMISHGW